MVLKEDKTDQNMYLHALLDSCVWIIGDLNMHKHNSALYKICKEDVQMHNNLLRMYISVHSVRKVVYENVNKTCLNNEILRLKMLLAWEFICRERLLPHAL